MENVNAVENAVENQEQEQAPTGNIEQEQAPTGNIEQEQAPTGNIELTLKVGASKAAGRLNSFERTILCDVSRLWHSVPHAVRVGAIKRALSARMKSVADKDGTSDEAHDAVRTFSQQLAVFIFEHGDYSVANAREDVEALANAFLTLTKNVNQEKAKDKKLLAAAKQNLRAVIGDTIEAHNRFTAMAGKWPLEKLTAEEVGALERILNFIEGWKPPTAIKTDIDLSI